MVISACHAQLTAGNSCFIWRFSSRQLSYHPFSFPLQWNDSIETDPLWGTSSSKIVCKMCAESCAFVITREWKDGGGGASRAAKMDIKKKEGVSSKTVSKAQVGGKKDGKDDQTNKKYCVFISSCHVFQIPPKRRSSRWLLPSYIPKASSVHRGRQ